MRAVFVTSLILGAGLTFPAADRHHHNRQRLRRQRRDRLRLKRRYDDCRQQRQTLPDRNAPGADIRSHSGTASSRVETSPSGLSGSSSAGPNGVAINVGGGRASGSVGDNGASAEVANQAAPGNAS